jgi:hypothetical protein
VFSLNRSATPCSLRVHEDVERIHDVIVNGRALEPVSEEDNVTS